MAAADVINRAFSARSKMAVLKSPSRNCKRRRKFIKRKVKDSAKMAILVKPSLDLKNSFLEMYVAYQSFGETDWCASHADAQTDFGRFVGRLLDDSKGIGIQSDWVPTSHFWLIYENRIGGTLGLRHKLTPVVAERAGHIGYDIAPPLRGRRLGHEILNLGLKEAHKLGIQDIMAICAETNIPSQKILIRHGSIERKKANGEIVYWLKTKQGID
jgi:predicted acetyltransferase